MPVTDTAKVCVFSVQDLQLMMNTHYIQNSVAWTPDTLHSLASIIAGWYNGTPSDTDGWKGWASSECEITNIRAYDAPTSPTIAIDYPVSIVGSDSSGGLPTGVTAAVKRFTGVPGRSYRGRIFWLGTPHSALVSGSEDTLQTSFTTGVVGALSNLATQLTAASADWEQVVYSRVADVATPVFGWTFADAFVDSQRRRLAGHNRR